MTTPNIVYTDKNGNTSKLELDSKTIKRSDIEKFYNDHIKQYDINE